MNSKLQDTWSVKIKLFLDTDEVGFETDHQVDRPVFYLLWDVMKWTVAVLKV